jgi:hypothetical protein
MLPGEFRWYVRLKVACKTWGSSQVKVANVELISNALKVVMILKVLIVTW